MGKWWGGGREQFPGGGNSIITKGVPLLSTYHASGSSRHLVCITSFSPHNHPKSTHNQPNNGCPCFTKRETEVQEPAQSHKRDRVESAPGPCYLALPPMHVTLRLQAGKNKWYSRDGKSFWYDWGEYGKEEGEGQGS